VFKGATAYPPTDFTLQAGYYGVCSEVLPSVKPALTSRTTSFRVRDVNSAKSCLQVIFSDVSELSQFRKKKRKCAQNMYWVAPPNGEEIYKQDESNKYKASPEPGHVRRREPACRPVWRLSG
jgi:hypothetical protein